MASPNFSILKKKRSFSGEVTTVAPGVNIIPFPEIKLVPALTKYLIEDISQANVFAMTKDRDHYRLWSFLLPDEWSIEKQDTAMRIELRKIKQDNIVEFFDNPEILISEDRQCITLQFGDLWLCDIDVDESDCSYEIEWNNQFHSDTIKSWSDYIVKNLDQFI